MTQPLVPMPASVVPVDLSKAYRLINHGPTVLVTAAHGGRSNVMAAAWSMPLDFLPPKVAVVIDAKTFTRSLVEASGEFALCVPTVSQMAAVSDVGNLTGRDVDKWQACGLSAFAGSRTQAPLVTDCVAWLECRCLVEPGLAQRHDLFLAEVVAAWADSLAFEDGRWQALTQGQRMLHHVAGGTFFSTGDLLSPEGRER